MTRLEELLGYHFKDAGLLETALTHSSYLNEHELPKEACNERLEFLGDAVLEQVSSEFLFRKYPDLMEGELSKLRASLVCEMSLADCARALSLGEFMRMGRGMEKMGGRNADAIISDAFEALIAALYLDSGIDEAKKLINRYLLEDSEEKRLFYDAKTILQEMAQEKGKSVHYRDLPSQGPEHDRVFFSEVLVSDEVFGSGKGHSKKKAEQDAAYAAITAIRNHNKCI